MEQKSQDAQPGRSADGKQPHKEPVIAHRPKDPNWLGVGSEPDQEPGQAQAGETDSRGQDKDRKA